MAIETSILIYWLFCLAATALIIFNRKTAYGLLGPESDLPHSGKGYSLSLLLGWFATLGASVAYILFTRKYETGAYELPDLLTFSISNGVLEQFMFIFWFLIGCYIGKRIAPNNFTLIFVFGYLGYAIFSGFIHAGFWVNVLPSHEPATAIMVPALSTMSLLWMWLAWKYRALVSIIAMHIVIDFLTIGHLNFHWFESIQLI